MEVGRRMTALTCLLKLQVNMNLDDCPQLDDDCDFLPFVVLVTRILLMKYLEA